MIGDKNKVLYDSLKRLLRRDATVHLKKIVNRSHAADLSAVFRSLPLSQQRRLFVLMMWSKKGSFSVNWKMTI